MAYSAFPSAGVGGGGDGGGGGGGGGGGFVLPPEVTLKGNTFNGANDLLNLDGSALASPANLPTLDLIRAPVANLPLAGLKIVNLGNPTLANDAATKSYVDALITGQQVKAAVAFATTANIALTGNQTVDGQSTGTSRGLVKNQTTATENGIYVAAAEAWVRSTDADTGPELVNASVFVSAGTVNGSTSWAQTTPAPITVGTSPIVFSQTGAAGATTLAGNGLNKVGNTFNALGTTNRIAVGTTIDIDAAYAGQSSITTLGTIGTGTWNAAVIGINKGGTAATTANNALNNLLPAQSGKAGDFLQTDGTNSSWQPTPGTLFVNVKNAPFNAQGNGVTDDTAAINNALASLSTGGICFFPAGTYMVSPSGLQIPADKLQIMGSGKGATTLKAITDFVHEYNHLLGASNKNGWTIKDLTVDMNHFIGSAIGQFQCNRWTVRDTEMINFKHYGINSSGGSHWRILDNYFLKTDPTGAFQNQAILSSEAGGAIQNYCIRGNEADGSGFLLDGYDSFVLDNFITHVAYGSGIALGITNFTFHVVVSGNNCQFATGQDVNGSWVSGYELWAPNCTVTGNIAYWNAGPGFTTFSRNSTFTGNIAHENSQSVNLPGMSAGYLNSTYNGSGSVWVGNRSYNAAATGGPQQYGFDVGSQLDHVVQAGNNWNGNKLGAANDNTGTMNSTNDVGVSMKVAWTPGTVGSGTQVQIPSTIFNAAFALGDQVIVSADVDLQGCVLFGYIFANIAATVFLRNATASPRTFGPLNLYLRTIKKSSSPNYG